MKPQFISVSAVGSAGGQILPSKQVLLRSGTLHHKQPRANQASSPCQYSLKPSRRGRPRQAKPVCFESWGLCCSQLETIFPWAALHMHPSRRYQGWRCPSSKHALVRNKLWRALCRIDRSIDSQHFSIEKPFSFLSTSCASAAGRENIFSCQWSARVCRVNDRVLHQGPTLFLEKKKLRDKWRQYVNH